jgi:serine phosphatase RsbU (regulator of sigma subunit)
MGQVRTAFRAYALGGEAPEVVVARLDGLIQAMDIGHFSTMLYLVLDPASGEMEMVQAGHPPPMLLHPDGQTRYLEASRGMAMGVQADGEYERVVESLAVGSTLVLYTDGLVESREGIGPGLARLDRCVRGLAGSTAPLSEQCGRLFRQMVPTPPEDDVAVLMLRLESGSDPVAAA